MRAMELSGIEGVRWLPDTPGAVGALVLAGSSGRVDSSRAELLARSGVVAESIRWLGGAGQHDGPWEIPLELFLGRVEGLAKDCERVVVLGTSFGAEAALLVGAHSRHVSTVIAFAPSDVVWAGVRPDGGATSHWTLGGVPLPYVPFDESWEQEDEVPAFVSLYEASRRRAPDRVEAARIPVERIEQVLLVAGGDDQVWPEACRCVAGAPRSRTGASASPLGATSQLCCRSSFPGHRFRSRDATRTGALVMRS